MTILNYTECYLTSLLDEKDFNDYFIQLNNIICGKNQLNIEHIYPQANYNNEKFIHTIGNLTLLTMIKNSQVKDNLMYKKDKAYCCSEFNITKMLNPQTFTEKSMRIVNDLCKEFDIVNMDKCFDENIMDNKFIHDRTKFISNLLAKYIVE